MENKLFEEAYLGLYFSRISHDTLQVTLFTFVNISAQLVIVSITLFKTCLLVDTQKLMGLDSCAQAKKQSDATIR